MIFKVYQLRRGGRKLSWRDAMNGSSYLGDLRLGHITTDDGGYKVAELMTNGGIASRLLPHCTSRC